MNRQPGWLLPALLVLLTVASIYIRHWIDANEQPAASSARALGIYPYERPDTVRDEARQALERDARRREQRFLNAAKPGHLFAATRVAADAMASMTPAALYEIGAQLFNHRFSVAEGFGGKDQSTLRRVHRGARGGPDAHVCAACHRRGGPAGAGDAADNAFLDGDGDRPDSSFERNPISLAGAGLVDLLAREMSRDLAHLRDDLVKQARSAGEARSVELVTKGVSFGRLTARADGAVDMTDITGVDRDLVIKPFGWKGHQANLREVVEDELLLHHGMQTSHLARTGTPDRVGPFGLPDPDGDGIQDEISAGQLDALTLFVAMQEAPVVGMPDDTNLVSLWSVGQRRFSKLGCAGCHVPSLPLESTIYELPSRNGGATLKIDLAKHGAEPRIARPAEGGGYRVYLHSDLKRHVVGPQLREQRSYRGVSEAAFLTRPLWGIARSRPYLHDARAPTLDRAILEHSGKATRARNAYAELNDEQRGPIRVYLMSLTRARRIVSP